MTDDLNEDFSPALGGAKAQPEPPPPPPPAEEPAAADPGARGEDAGPGDEFPAEIAALLGPFGRLAEIFADAAQGRPPTARTPGTLGIGDEAADVLAREVEAFMGGAIRELSQRLPATLAALGGIVDAVEQAVAPLADELGGAFDAANARPAAPPQPEIVDAVDAVDAVDPTEIPPVDLPPNQ